MESFGYNLAMEGITTALVVYAFVCIARPELIRNRSQFYAAFGVTIIMMITYGVLTMLGLSTIAVGITSLLQVGAVILMFLSTGGMKFTDLGDEMKGAYEVIRRGEEEKETIIPPGKGAPTPGETQI